MSWADDLLARATMQARELAGNLPNFSDWHPFSNPSDLLANPMAMVMRPAGEVLKMATNAAVDLNIKSQGFEPFNKLPADYMPPDEQQSSDVQNRNIASLVADYAKATTGRVADAAASVVDALTPSPGSMPLWVKFTVAGAVVIGSAVVLQSLMSGRRYA